jgi:uncharacterized protein (TIGR02145 family)
METNKKQFMKNYFIHTLCVIATVAFVTFSGCGTTDAIYDNNFCNQYWRNYNLNVTTYKDGTKIPEVTDSKEWAKLTTGAWCHYNNDAANDTKYGKLYNWYAVNDSRGLAPAGYHIPTDTEWTTLSTCLGGNNVSGGALKEFTSSDWLAPNTGASNLKNFYARPGGVRDDSGNFSNITKACYFWTNSSANTSSAWFRRLDYNSSKLIVGNLIKNNGYSVRIVRN